MEQATAVPELLTWEQVCGLLKIGRTKLFELTRSGDLRSVSLPSATGQRRPLRYEMAEVQRFIAANRNSES